MTKSGRNQEAVYWGVLGVCPLLARATTLLTGVTIGVAALCMLVLTLVSVSSCRRYIPYQLRLPVILVISVTWVTLLDLLMQAWWFEMRQALGIYLPLLALNSFILLSLEQTALTTPPVQALKATLGRAVAILGIVSLLGCLRELLGRGALMTDATALLGEEYGQWTLVEHGYSLLLQAPGALLCLGLLLAAFRYTGQRRPVLERSSGQSI